jgi:hypothetical protein
VIKLKDSVRPRSLVILAAAVNVHASMVADDVPGTPADLLVTSGNDSKHRSGSRHYDDRALDFRSRTFAHPGTKRLFMERLRARLGQHYDVILEDEDGPNEHFHVEHDPKPPSGVQTV